MGASMFSPLKYGKYRKLFFSDLFSESVNWLDFTALTVLIAYTWKLGSGSVAALMITLGLPWVVVGPLLGVMADRLPRRQVMLFCTFIRIIVIAGFILAPNLYVLLPLVFLKGSMGSLFTPARQGAIRELVPMEELPKAISLSQLCSFGTKIIAPTLGGSIITHWGPNTVFELEIGLLLCSILMLLQLPTMKPTAANKDTEKPKFWTGFREGFAYIGTSRILAISIILGAIGLFLVFLYDGLLVIWVKHLSLGSTEYGRIMGAMGFGSIAGAVASGQFSGWRKNPLQALCITGTLLGLLDIVIGMGGLGYLHGSSWMWIVIFGLFGLLGAASAIPFGYILQVETPSELIGRVTSVAGAIQNGSSLVAPAVGAVLSNSIGVGGVFAAAGVLMAIIAILVLLSNKRLVSSSRQNRPNETSPVAQ